MSLLQRPMIKSDLAGSKSVGGVFYKTKGYLLITATKKVAHDQMKPTHGCAGGLLVSKLRHGQEVKGSLPATTIS